MSDVPKKIEGLLHFDRFHKSLLLALIHHVDLSRTDSPGFLLLQTIGLLKVEHTDSEMSWDYIYVLDEEKIKELDERTQYTPLEIRLIEVLENLLTNRDEEVYMHEALHVLRKVGVRHPNAVTTKQYRQDRIDELKKKAGLYE